MTFVAASDLEQRLEPQRQLATAGVLAHGKGGVLELDVGELCLPRVKGTELQHVKLQEKVHFEVKLFSVQSKFYQLLPGKVSHTNCKYSRDKCPTISRKPSSKFSVQASMTL